MASPPCGNCRDNIFYDDESIHCDGDCKRFFHKKCVDVTETEYSNYYSDNGKWYCNKPNCVKLNKSYSPSVYHVISKLNQLHSKVNSIGALAPEITKIKAEICQFEHQPSTLVKNSNTKVEELNTLTQKVDNIYDTVTELLRSNKHGPDKPVLHQPRIQVSETIMEDCTQVIDISDIGFDISELGRVKVGTLIVNETPYDIYKGENVIGRDELSDIVLRNNSISSKHAVVEVEDWDTHLLFDCGSTNKTRLGNIFLKPNVRYNLQGGEDITFANLKAKYIKLDKPETDQNDEDSVSDAGSESILNSVPGDQGADLDIVNNDQSSLQAQDNHAEDVSHNSSNMFSDLNDSSLLEENKRKAASSKLQVVDASDDSTDDEVDFIPPSQTVKEFASKKQLALKNKGIKDTSSDIFSTGNVTLNTQEQEMIFMTEKTDCDKISNSLDLNTQNLFSSEVQESLKSKCGVIRDQSVFEAETQDSGFALEKNEETGPRSRASRDIFDAETEVPEACASGNDVDMSDLELSSALTESTVSIQKPNPINTDKIKDEDKINTPVNSLVNNLVKIKKQEDASVASILQNAETNNGTSLSIPNLSDDKSNIITKVKGEVPNPNPMGNMTELHNNLTEVGVNYEIDTTDLSDFMTQLNPCLGIKGKTFTSSIDEIDDDDICTQVNTSLKAEPLKNLVKKEINIKAEPEDDFNFTAEETQLNLNLHEKNNFNTNQIMSKISNTRPTEDITNNEGEDTQPNFNLYSLFSESRIKSDREVDVIDHDEHPSHRETAITEESDSTDFEEDCNLLQDKVIKDNSIIRDQGNVSNIVDPPTITTNSPKTKNEYEIDESSNQSDSLLASVPLDPELLEQEGPQSVNLNYSEREKGNENCENNLKPSQTICDEGLKKYQQEMTIGDMDICSTVGDGTYVSACERLRKAENNSKIKRNQLENSCKKIPSESTNLFFDLKKISETESLNHSVVFNEPCSSSTPFRTEERVMTKNVKVLVVKTPPRGIVERVVESPDLPCTDELVEVACQTPERQVTTPISESSKPSENLPLALKRTPRARKLSRKVAEALEEQQQKSVTLMPRTLVSKNKNTKNAVVTDNPKGEDSDNFQVNYESKKKVGNKKSGGLQKDCTEAEGNKSIADSNKGILKQNDCVKNLSVNLTDITGVHSKKANAKQSGIEEHSPAKRAKVMEVKENSVENPKEEYQSVLKRPTDKRQNKHVDQLKFKEKKPETAIKTPSKQLEEKNGEFHDYDTNLKINESGGKPKHIVDKLANLKQGKNTSLAESLTKKSFASSSIITNDIDGTNDHHGSSLLREKLHTKVISDQPSSKKLINIKEKPTSEDKQLCDKASMRTKMGSRSSTLSKSGHLIEGNISDIVKSSVMRKSNRSEVKKPLSKKELSIDSKSLNNKSELEHLINMELIHNDMNEHVIPLKRSRTIEEPCNLHTKKTKENKNTEKKYQKSAEEVKEDTIKFTTQVSSDTKIIDNNRRQSKYRKKDTRAKGKVEKDINEVPSSESPSKYKTFPEASIRKSNRRKKEDIVDTSYKKESKVESKSLSITKSTFELRSKSMSNDNLIEKPEAKTRTNKRKKEEESIKPHILKEISKSEAQSKVLNETNFTSNPKNKLKTKGRLLDESVENKTKSGSKDNYDDLLESSNIVDDHQENLTRFGNPTRSRVKPDRFREKDDIYGSDSICIGSDRGPLSSKRRKGRHDSTSVESVISTTCGVNNTESNEEHSVFIAPSKSTSRDAKKHSEIFKTPVVEDRSRSRQVGNEKSRSRSRSDSSQSSLKSDTSSALQSPRRSGARGKRVLFTSGLINATWESQVKKLGGSVVDCPVECSLLVADKVRRTVKFLCVLGQGKPIVSLDWLTQSWRCTSFIEPMDHLLTDKEAEEKFEFSLSQTMQAARNQPLLQGFHIHTTPSVKPPPEDIKSIVECCGGEYLEKAPSKWPANTVIISHVDDKSLWKKLKVKGQTPPIVAAEMLLIGVLQHKLEIEPHRIS